MARFLRRFIDAGVTAEMSPEEAKYIQMGNMGSLLMISVIVPYMALCVINSWWLVFVEMCVLNVLLLGTALLNRFRLHLVALVYFGTLLNLHLVFVTVAMGRETLLQLLIFFTAGGVITLIPRGRTGLIVVSLANIFFTYEAALFLEKVYGPLYRLTPGQITGLRLFVEYTIFVLIIVNALIGRLGAIAAEDRLREEQKRSEGLYLQVQEQDRIKTAFFQNVSHELRTPLTLILGPLDGMLAGADGPVPEPQRNRLDMMMRNANRLLRLINQLLDLSKIDVGRMRLRVQRGDLRRFVDFVAAPFSSYAERKGVGLSVGGAAGGIFMYYDQEIVEKAVSNLLSNALKFTPAGGEVAVTVTGSAGGGAAISVRDTGIGIPPGDAGRIFDRFHQVDGTTTRSQEGTGIGLSLVRELVQIHGGTVEYKSGSGKGAEFVLTIPAGAERLAVAEVLPGDAGVEPDRAARGPDSQANASNPTQDSIHHDARMLPSFGLVAGQLRRRVKKQLVRPGGP